MIFRTLHLALLCAASTLALAAPGGAIPPEVDAALNRAKIPREAVALLVQEADGNATTTRLSHRAQQPMNPASVMKLTTTYAALDLLGPAYTWSTPVYVEGTVRDGTLTGNVTIKGQGDPKLVLERLWLLLRRLRGLGIQTIAGDIVLDRSALEIPDADPANFDGEPLRPYNVAPDALLINFKAVVMTFTPDRASNTAQVQFDPPLYGVQMQATVPLGTGDCGDYRGALKADFSDATRIRFGGTYAASCGEKIWPVAYADPRSYAVRAVQGMWLDMGGKITGSVRFGNTAAALTSAKPTLEVNSATLAEIIRDINKYSNNVMAQQVFLSLGRTVPMTTFTSDTSPDGATPLSAGSFTASRAVMQRWWKDRIDGDELPVWDNGSGLSRHERISAQALARMLQVAYRSPFMSELMSSLPISGVDGTLKRFKSKTVGGAHLKTGTLSNVIARAGFVDGASGKRYVLVALINHANANTEGARSVMEALVDWTAKEVP